MCVCVDYTGHVGCEQQALQKHMFSVAVLPIRKHAEIEKTLSQVFRCLRLGLVALCLKLPDLVHVKKHV